jgi:hypothetical protein
MGKISEKEKRCIENIDAISDLQKSYQENIFLVLKFMQDFWDFKVKDY